jgi:hypothetical protein
MAEPPLLDLLEEFKQRRPLAPEDRMPEIDRHEAEPVILDEAGRIRKEHGTTPIFLVGTSSLLDTNGADALAEEPESRTGVDRACTRLMVHAGLRRSDS